MSLPGEARSIPPGHGKHHRPKAEERSEPRRVERAEGFLRHAVVVAATSVSHQNRKQLRKSDFPSEREVAAGVLDDDADGVAFACARNENRVGAALGDAVALAAGAGDLDLVRFALLDLVLGGAGVAAFFLLDGAERAAGLAAQHLDAVLGFQHRVGEATLRAGDELRDVAVDGSLEVRDVERAVVPGAVAVELAARAESALDRPMEVLGVAVDRVGDLVEVRQSRERAVRLADRIGDRESVPL